MPEKNTLTGVPETMLQTVYARARESAGRGAIRDETAEQIIGSLDYDFSLAEKDTAMRSGVIARTIVLDRLVGAWLGRHPGHSRRQSGLRPRYPLLPDEGVSALVQPRPAGDDRRAAAAFAGERRDLAACHVRNGRLGRGDPGDGRARAREHRLPIES